MEATSLRRTTKQMNLLKLMDKKSSTIEIKAAGVVEKDSGVYDPMSVNYSRSNCTRESSASNCPDRTSASSAYASVTSSCCDSSRLRPEASPSPFPHRADSSRVPHHPKVTDALPSELNCFGDIATIANLALPSAGTSSYHHIRSRGGSATSTHSEASISESSRFLYNVDTCKIYEKRRLLGKVRQCFASVVQYFTLKLIYRTLIIV